MNASTPTPSVNAPTLRQAADAVFTEDEKQKLKDNLITAQIDQAKYLRAHPEISKAIQLAVSAMVKAQPDDAIDFLTEFLGSDALEDRVVLAQATEEDVKWKLAHRNAPNTASQ